MKFDIFQQNYGFQVDLRKEFNDWKFDLFAYIAIMTIVILGFNIPILGFLKFILFIVGTYSTIRIIFLRSANSGKFDYLAQERAIGIEKRVFPIIPDSVLFVTKISEDSWRPFKPHYARVQSTSTTYVNGRRVRKSSSSIVSEILFELILEIFVYLFRWVLLLVKPRATYWLFELGDQMGNRMGFLHARAYSQENMDALVIEVQNILQLPMQFNKDEIKQLGMSEYFNSLY
ncbi:MAG: hypothetical protein INQ03_15945 [Candidatus Heimdallarchaeota archaeon]|nr:hypothetical protein [Candidatus Heimdallarchaeota archaeon]